MASFSRHPASAPPVAPERERTRHLLLRGWMVFSLFFAFTAPGWVLGFGVPLTAIVGGVIASEVIKVISGKERPLNNTFIFEGNPDMNGYCMRIGPSFDCPWGVDNGVFKEEKARQIKE